MIIGNKVRLRRHHYHAGGYCDVLLMGMLRDEWNTKNPESLQSRPGL